jgi:hypothetical protein
MDAAIKVHKRGGFRFRNLLSTLGPLTTGASDDDPSGIGTYSQAGAQLGLASRRKIALQEGQLVLEHEPSTLARSQRSRRLRPHPTTQRSSSVGG